MNNEQITFEILEVFDDFLEECGIEIPCKYKDEQEQRYDGGNTAKIYGTEYGDLFDRVCELIAQFNINN